MSYLEQEGLSRRQWYAIIFVGLLHVALGYALVTGLAVKAVQVITGPLETVNIIEEAPPPPEETPPPPPKVEDIPPYVPPPDVQVETSAPPPPTITTQTAVAIPDPVVVAPPAPPAPVVAPPAPPAIPGTPATAIARSFTVTEDDYPDASRRAGEEGVTGVRVTVGTNGRVSNCTVVKSSGFSRLDERACQIAERRWRFKPATENGEPVETTVNRNYQWRLQEGR